MRGDYFTIDRQIRGTPSLDSAPDTDVPKTDDCWTARTRTVARTTPAQRGVGAAKTVGGAFDMKTDEDQSETAKHRAEDGDHQTPT